MELGHLVATLRRWWWFIVIVPIATGGLAFLVAQQQPTIFTAQVELTVGPSVDNPTADLNALRASAQYLQTFTQLAKTRPFLQEVANELNLDRGIGSLPSQISVSSDTNAQVMTITVRDPNRRRAISIANSLANVLVRYSSTNQGNEAGLGATQIRAEIERLRAMRDDILARIQQLESDLVTAQQVFLGPSVTEQRAKIRRLEGAVSSAGDPTLEKAIAERQARIRELEMGLRSTSSVQAQQLILNELAREDARLASDQATLRDLQRLALDQLAQERNKLQEMQNAQTQQVNDLTSELNVQRSRLADIQRALSDLYTALRTASTNQIKVIDPAVAASADAPNIWLNTFLAVVGGLLLGITLAFVFDFLQNTLRRPEDLAQLEGAHLLGSVAEHPPLTGLGKEALVVHALSQTRAAENMRMLSAKLAPPDSAVATRTLLFCSSDHGEDAAELAANLGVILTQMGKRVVLCDANLRRPIITQLFDLEGQKGLTDALAAKVSQLNLYPIGWAPGLYILPRGTGDPLAFELLASTQMAQLTERLQHDADLIIYVGAPLITFADSLAIAPRMDGVVLLVRQGKTRRAWLAEAIQSLVAVGAKLEGVVFFQNRVDGIQVASLPETQTETNKGWSSRWRQARNVASHQFDELVRRNLNRLSDGFTKGAPDAHTDTGSQNTR